MIPAIDSHLRELTLADWLTLAGLVALPLGLLWLRSHYLEWQQRRDPRPGHIEIVYRGDATRLRRKSSR